MSKEFVRQNNSLKTEKADLPESTDHTITTDIIFEKFPHNKSFFREVQCLEYIKNKKSIYLFGEDYNAKSIKRFFGLNYKTIYLLSTQKRFHLYEYYGREDKLKLFLDIDIKSPDIPKNVNRTEYFNHVIKKSINTVIKHLKTYNINNSQIIILSACGESKLSAHIIFNDVIFRNILEMNFFMPNIKSPLIDDKTIDMKPYRKGCFRMLWNSKYGTDRILEFYENTNYTY